MNLLFVNNKFLSCKISVGEVISTTNIKLNKNYRYKLIININHSYFIKELKLLVKLK